MFSAAMDAERSSRRAPVRSHVYNIRETMFLYYNSLIFALCREKEVQRQGLAVFCPPMLKLSLFVLLLAAPGAFAAPGGDISVAEKIAVAGTEKEISKREKLYRELGDARDGAATAVLSRAALSDAEPGARIDAILALRKIGGPEALKGLLEALSKEKHKGVRIQAVNSLGFFNAPEALARLRDTARNDPDKDLRTSAAMALARLNDAQALSDNFAVETDTSVKLGIIDALGRVEGGEKELKKLKAGSKDAKMNERLDFYTGEKKKKPKKK